MGRWDGEGGRGRGGMGKLRTVYHRLAFEPVRGSQHNIPRHDMDFGSTRWDIRWDRTWEELVGDELVWEDRV